MEEILKKQKAGMAKIYDRLEGLIDAASERPLKPGEIAEAKKIIRFFKAMDEISSMNLGIAIESASAAEKALRFAFPF